MELLPIISPRGNIIIIGFDEIVAVVVQGDEIEIRTRTRRGRPLRSLQEYERLFTPFGFEKASNSSIVSIEKVWTFCEQSRTLYFDKLRKTEGIKVSRRNAHKFKGL
ncbi:DNA-binding LytR/AlgR family response regulator [Paenibacillus sp. 4624]|uniref:LytTR family transcriptional regulator DNA-binding domain-containing protein n=1 Tax=Paenibacillus sp. 4624 TaxID=3156453 RepID=UPI003D1ABC3D